MVPKKVIVAGPIRLELTPDPSSINMEQINTTVQPEQVFDMEGVTLGLGGGAAETALSLHRLGVPVRLIGKIGDDRFGKTVLDQVADFGPDLTHGLIVDPSTSTGVAIHARPPGENESVIYFPGANNTFYASDIPRADLQKADLFHFADPSAMRSIYRNEGGELISILQRARREGLTTSLAVSLPEPSSPAGAMDWPAFLENNLPIVDIFFCDVTDLVYLFRRDDIDGFSAEAVTADLLHNLSGRALAFGVKIVLIQLGRKGVYLRAAPGAAWKKAGRALAGFDEAWHGQELWAPALTGDGKSRLLISGFLGGLLRGEEPGTALMTASAAAASQNDIS